jgi:hypothetical protein
MSFLHEAAERGNEYPEPFSPAAEGAPATVPSFYELTRGGREVQKRTRWSASLSNAVAVLAGLSEVEAS